MAAHYRIKAHTRRVDAKPYPFLSCDWALVIDLDGYAMTYLRLEAKGKGRRRAWQLKAALESLRTDYRVALEPSDPSPVSHGYGYTAIYADERLAEACHTLLSLGVKARLILEVKQPGPLARFTIHADRPVSHILSPYFPETRALPKTRLQSLLRGIRPEPRRLHRLSLPALPGIGGVESIQLPFPDLEPMPKPSIPLGHILSPLNHHVLAEARLPLLDLTRGTLATGTTGSGKTNTVLHTVCGLPDDVWALIFDVKREYRCLQPRGAKVYGFRGHSVFTHNLLKPVGSPSEWVKQFSGILSEVIHRHSPAVGSKDVVASELDRLYRERGIYDGSRDYPHVGDLIQALEARQRSGNTREVGWIASALRVLRALMIGETRRAFCVRQGLALERLLMGTTVVELDGLGDTAASALLVSVLLQQVRNHHAHDVAQNKLRGLIVVEEAQHMLAEGGEATSVIAATCREIRAYGIGLVYVTQTPSSFSRNALANANTILCHRLLHPSDRSVMAKMLNLDGDQADLLGRLEVGEALAQVRGLKWLRVLEVKRPHVRDEDLPPVRVEREDVATDYARRRDTQNRAAGLSEWERTVLDTVVTGEAVWPRAIREHLRVNQDRVTTALKALLRRGFVAYRRARKGGPGQPPSIYFPTPAGEEAYRVRHGGYGDRKAGRSVKHAEVVEDVCQRFGIEHLPHRRFDILYREGGREGAIEVETGSNHNRQLMENLVKSLDFQGEGRFIAVDVAIRNRVLQAGAKRCYDTGQTVVVKVVLVDELPKWTRYTFEAPNPTTT